ncbi:hypothetical protein DL93DRAFT_2091901, partial [Clavulina sp. PMI_390]
MSDLLMTPRKKKRSAADFDEEVLTPKKVRMAPPSPPPTVRKRISSHRSLPGHLSRLLDLHRSIETAISSALATSSSGFLSSSSAGTDESSSSSEPASSYMPNVINHLGLLETVVTRQFSVDDLSRLVWLWEWDGEELPDKASSSLPSVESNPFLDTPKDWIRGGMGIIVSSTTHSSRAQPKRTPAYGIGIEVQKLKKGMKSVAQWTAAAESRRQEVTSRLECWVALHTKARVKERETSRASSPTPSPIPNLPFSALPKLPTASLTTTRTSALARTLLDASPHKSPFRSRPPEGGLPPIRSSTSFPLSPASSISSRASMSRTPSPIKSSSLANSLVSPVKGLDAPFDLRQRPSTPENSRQTPVPQTPTTARRAALRERLMQKSQNTPTKGGLQVTSKNADGDEVVHMLAQEDVKRRLLLGRLPDVAQAVWMLFTTSPQSPSSNPTPPTRRRRAIPIEEVVQVIVKSARSPINSVEATDSLRMLTELCPDFIKSLLIDGSEWLQMASSTGPTPPSPSAKRDVEAEVRRGPPGSPGSPVRIRAGAITLREVKARIQK